MKSEAKLTQSGEGGVKNAQDERQKRTEIFTSALSGLEEQREELIVRVRRMPIEIGIEDIYRAVIASKAEYDELREKIREEIGLLSSGKGNLMSHINLLSGQCS